jgi:hypothetical protein
MMRLRTLAIAGSLLSVAACGQNTTGVDGDRAPASYAADEVAVRVENNGGTIAGPAPWPLIVSVYGDGRVIVQRMQRETFPLPALPDVQVQRISTADVRRLVQRALDAGVAAEPDVGKPARSDSATTRFLVSTKDGLEKLAVYDLEYLPDKGRNRFTKEQLAARSALRGLYAELTDLTATLGSDAVSAPVAYAPESIVATVSPWEPPRTDTGPDPEIAWPGPVLPGQPLATRPDVGCVVVTGTATAAVLAAGAKATSNTPWTSGSGRWTVRLRPVLPDEKPCPPEPGMRTCGICPE